MKDAMRKNCKYKPVLIPSNIAVFISRRIFDKEVECMQPWKLQAMQ